MESIDMAENIVELLTDVADAIREKKGSTEPINAQSFADEIKNLPSGGDIENIIDESGLGINLIQSVIFGQDVSIISEKAYYYCRNLKTITIPEGVKRIDSMAFAYCSSVESVSLPSSLGTLGLQSFAQMTSLKSFDISLEAQILSLPRNLFWNSPLLEKIIIPKNVANIAGYVFEGCSGLIYVDFSNVTSVTALENVNAFSGVNNAYIIVPDALYDSWIAATNWSSLADRIVKNSEYTRPL